MRRFFRFDYEKGLNLMKVWSVKKQSCGLFLAKERELGTVAVCNGQRAISMLTAKAVKQTASPVASTRKKHWLCQCFFQWNSFLTERVKYLRNEIFASQIWNMPTAYYGTNFISYCVAIFHWWYFPSSVFSFGLPHSPKGEGLVLSKIFSTLVGHDNLGVPIYFK